MIISLSPPQYAAAFNPIPIGLYCEPNPALENYVAKIHIVYNPNGIDTIVANSSSTSIVTFLGFNSYNVGDQIFIFDRSTTGFIANHTGYYTVLEILTTNSIIIDLTIVCPFPPGASNVSYAYNYIPYQMEPAPNSFVNLDIHNTVKDFVGTSILPTTVNTTSTMPNGQEAFQYGLIFGEEYNFVFNFNDNLSSSGNLAFYSTLYGSPDQIPFKIGDTIVVEQNRQQWIYTDNYVATGSKLAFINGTMTSSHNFQIGDQIFVTGQDTYITSNGYTTVTDVPDVYSLVTEKNFPGSTPAEPGIIFGYPTPQYDGIATITDIYYEPSLMALVIKTDKIHNESTLPISGSIRLANNKKFGNLSVDTTIIFPDEGRPIYSYAHICRFDREHYSRIPGVAGDMGPGFSGESVLESKFILGTPDKLWSTILPQDGTYNRIDIMSPGFILFRQQVISGPINAAFIYYVCYDKDLNVIGQFYYPSSFFSTGDGFTNNGYADINLKSLSNNGSIINVGGFDLNTQYTEIKYFDIQVFSDASGNGVPTFGDEISTKIGFMIDQECTNLPTYNLTWLDSFGSYITFPFKYNTVQSTDVKRNNFYRKESEWANAKVIRPPFPPTVNTQLFQNIGMRGENTYSTNSRTKLELTSGWLKDKENIIFEDLMKSADVYVSYNDINMLKEIQVSESMPEWVMYPVELEANNIEYESNYANQFIFNYTPIVRLAFNDVRYNNWNISRLSRGGK